MSEDKWKARLQDRSEEDKLIPLETLDVNAINDFDDMLSAMSLTAFNGRRLGEAAEVLQAMIADPECSVILTLSGAMTVAKMGLLITEMVERGWVQAIVSTGALMTHGLVELSGMDHFKAQEKLDDTELFERGYNRVYDTYELETNLTALGNALDKAVFPDVLDQRFGSFELMAAMGRWLAPRGRGVVGACYRNNVPIYVPAFTDSEMGLDVATWFIKRQVNLGRRVKDITADFKSNFDPFRDLTHYARTVRFSPKLGIFTIGGGVPRNWAQQGPPFLDYLNTHLERESVLNRFSYGVRICPEPVHWGGLSGCTYSEGVSWGKFVPPEEGGRFAEVYSDATLVWPMLVKGIIQRMEKQGVEAGHPDLGDGPLAPPLEAEVVPLKLRFTASSAPPAELSELDRARILATARRFKLEPDSAEAALADGEWTLRTVTEEGGDRVWTLWSLRPGDGCLFEGDSVAASKTRLFQFDFSADDGRYLIEDRALGLGMLAAFQRRP